MKTCSVKHEALKGALSDAPPRVVDKLASRVISEGICAHRDVQRLTIPLSLSSEDTAARRSARTLLANSIRSRLGNESMPVIFHELVSEGRLSLDALPSFVGVLIRPNSMENHHDADPAPMVGALSAKEKSGLLASAARSEDGLTLIGKSAIRMSLHPSDPMEKRLSMGVLAAIGLGETSRLFQEMVDSGELPTKDTLPFLEIFVEIKSMEVLASLALEKVSQPEPAPGKAPVEIPVPAMPPGKTLSPGRAKEKPGLSGSLLLDMDPAELRAADLKRYRVNKTAMYRLICIECFRVGTTKPLIGKSYAPLVSLQSNLQRRLNGDPKLKRLFEQCWKRMVTSKAIILGKCGTVASIVPRSKGITNRHIREALDWALENHRHTQAV